MHKSLFLALLLIFLFPNIAFAQVVINEFSVQPEDKNDWIEIYAFESVDISGWKLADTTGSFETFSQGTVLGAGEYKVVVQYQRLGNEGDTIILKTSTDEIKDQISYGGSGNVCIPLSNETIARIPDGGNTYDKVSTPSKGTTNNSALMSPCPSPTPEPTSTSTPTPKPTNTSTPTPSPKPSSTPTPTSKPTSTPTPSPKITDASNSDKNDQAGLLKNDETLNISGDNNPQVLAERDVENKENLQDGNKIPFQAITLILLGIFLTGFSVFKLYRKSNTN